MKDGTRVWIKPVHGYLLSLLRKPVRDIVTVTGVDRRGRPVATDAGNHEHSEHASSVRRDRYDRVSVGVGVGAASAATAPSDVVDAVHGRVVGWAHSGSDWFVVYLDRVGGGWCGLQGASWRIALVENSRLPVHVTADPRLAGAMCGNSLAWVRGGRFSDGSHAEAAFMLWANLARRHNLRLPDRRQSPEAVGEVWRRQGRARERHRHGLIREPWPQLAWRDRGRVPVRRRVVRARAPTMNGDIRDGGDVSALMRWQGSDAGRVRAACRGHGRGQWVVTVASVSQPQRLARISARRGRAAAVPRAWAERAAKVIRAHAAAGDAISVRAENGSRTGAA